MKKYIWSGATAPWSFHTRTQKTQTFDAIKAAGEEGITREQVCAETGLPKQRVWFYLSELRRSGLIKRMGDAIDPASLGPDESKLYALSAMENALVAHATKFGTTPDIERQFLRYQKIKALALGAKTDGETKAALRMAILDLVKMVF